MHISQQVHDPILWSMIHTPFVYKTTQQKCWVCTVCLMLTDAKEFNNLFWSGIAKTNVYVSKMNEKTWFELCKCIECIDTVNGG